MIVRDLISDQTVTAAGTMIIGSISLGVYRPIRLEEVTNVSRITLTYTRNGTSATQFGTIVPYENSVVDLSALSTLHPSVTEATMFAWGPSFVDVITVNYVESGTSKSITLRVINAASKNARLTTQLYARGLSDYANGKFNQLDFRITKASPLTGAAFFNKIIYGQSGTSDVLRHRPAGGSSLSSLPNGEIWSNPIGGSGSRELVSPSGDVWGLLQYELKYPYCPDPNKRVTLRWLNSMGAYDTMFFDQYRIMPNYLINYSGGNRISSYEVTVGTVVTADNEKALLQLSRTTDVAGVFPIDTTQWARVTIMNPNAFNAQGGALGRAVNYKCKFEIIEP